MNNKAVAQGIATRESILSMVRRSGGASTSDICAAVDRSKGQVSEHLVRLRKSGEALTVTIANGQSSGFHVRHFGCQADADEWEKAERQRIAARRAARLYSVAPRSAIPGTGLNKEKKKAKPVQPENPNGVQPQRIPCRAVNARWQALELQPDPRWPSFASVPLGVNPDTGRAWGAAG